MPSPHHNVTREAVIQLLKIRGWTVGTNGLWTRPGRGRWQTHVTLKDAATLERLHPAANVVLEDAPLKP